MPLRGFEARTVEELAEAALARKRQVRNITKSTCHCRLNCLEDDTGSRRVPLFVRGEDTCRRLVSERYLTYRPHLGRFEIKTKIPPFTPEGRLDWDADGVPVCRNYWAWTAGITSYSLDYILWVSDMKEKLSCELNFHSTITF